MSYRILLTSTVLSAALAVPALAQYTVGDREIDGSLCVGNDCINGENFGFDTIRLKENNLRIDFTDTSNSASFPTQDWQLVANESSNGGLNAFWIQSDQPTGSGNRVFLVEAGARNNALYVENSGEVGIGTNNPVADVHIKIGDTPTVRLEQDGTSGFTPQTWDMAGNETNWFIRDATTGSRLPLRVRPGASTSSIDIDGDGNVRIGHANTAGARLHVRRTDGTAAVLIEEASGTQAARGLLTMSNNGGSFITMANTNSGNDWFFTHENGPQGRFIVNRSDDPTAGMKLSAGGDLTIGGGLISTEGGGACTVADPCDAVFDPALYTVPSIEEHAALMWENKHLPAVGPTPPDAPLDVTLKLVRMLNELEHAHIYIEQLNEHVKAQNARIETLERRIARQ